MSTQKLLLPYNFTALDKKALEFVLQTFARPKEVAITLFNSYTPVPEIRTEHSSVMGKMKSNLQYLQQKVAEQENELKSVAQTIVSDGFAPELVHYIFAPKKTDVAGAIIDLALSKKFNIIVLSRKPGRVTRFFTGSVFSKVVSALRGRVVCIVS